MAEAAFRGTPPDRRQLKTELDGLFRQPGGDRIDVVGLGCTHYTFLLDAMRDIGPAHIMWLDPAPAVARQTARVLAQCGAAPSVPSPEPEQVFLPQCHPTSLPCSPACAGWVTQRMHPARSEKT